MTELQAFLAALAVLIPLAVIIFCLTFRQRSDWQIIREEMEKRKADSDYAQAQDEEMRKAKEKFKELFDELEKPLFSENSTKDLKNVSERIIALRGDLNESNSVKPQQN